MDERSLRIQRRLEWPLVAAALLTIPVIVISHGEFSDGWKAVGTVLNWLTWLVFVAEIVVMLAVVPDRRFWLRTHMLDLAIVVLSPPFLPAAFQEARVFRLFRLLRLVRLVTLLRGLLTVEGLQYAALLVATTVLVGGTAFAAVENDPNLDEWDGVWWALSTVTTVGYGDIVPETEAGRAIAVFVMVVGVGFVALLTAAVAERFIRREAAAEIDFEEKLLVELREIRERLDKIEARS